MDSKNVLIFWVKKSDQWMGNTVKKYSDFWFQFWIISVFCVIFYEKLLKHFLYELSVKKFSIFDSHYDRYCGKLWGNTGIGFGLQIIYNSLCYENQIIVNIFHKSLENPE